MQNSCSFFLTLDDMRVVLQEKVVQVFGDEGRHASICQSYEEYGIRMKESQKSEVMDKKHSAVV